MFSEEIVDAAGVTKPTLYHYFGSKRGLLAALLALRPEPDAGASRERRFSLVLEVVIRHACPSHSQVYPHLSPSGSPQPSLSLPPKSSDWSPSSENSWLRGRRFSGREGALSKHDCCSSR